MRDITAWLSIGSTYTFLTALRIKKKIKEEGINLKIKPFSIRQIMKNQNNIPFPPEKRSKVAYMWRDIERRAELYNLPKPNMPAPYPLKNFDIANKVSIVSNNEGWFLDYFEETYKQWFIQGKEAGSEENLQATLTSLGKKLADVIHSANQESIGIKYSSNTKEAMDLGIFGAPSFSVEKEIFWGDDRLEDAIHYSKN